VVDEMRGRLDPEVPADPRPPTRLAPLRRPFFAALAVSSLAFSFVRTPLAFATFEGPGRVVAVGDRLRGAEARPGRILILSVADAPATGLSLVRGALDSAVDVHWQLPWTRPASSRESDIAGRQLAEASAVVAASACVGRPVAFSGGGVIVTGDYTSPDDTGVIPSGDQLVRADGRPVHGIEDLYAAAAAAGGKGTLAVEARSADGAVHLGSLPFEEGDEGAPRLREPLERRPVVLADVDGGARVDLRGLVQSSSGLASALGLVDATGPAPLAAGRRIAATGTIGTDGVVGPILGLRFKAAAAQRAGASIMLVPAGQAEFARRYAGAVSVIGVNSLDEAVRAIGGSGCLSS
jgi:PDZ domain-containing protein